MDNQQNKEALRTLAEAGLDALFGGSDTPQAAAPVAPGAVTLRYGPCSAIIPASDLGSRTVGDLFRLKADDLGGLNLSGNVSIRDENGVVSATAPAVAGATYVASVRKEDKGN